MVRTKANNAAVRKAVVAKAPRKNLAPARGGGVASPSSSSGKKKGKLGGAGNPIKVWPAPSWQKGLQDFFGGEGTSSSGCSSSSSSANTSLTEGELMASEQPVASSCTRSELGSEGEGTSSSAAGSSRRLQLLDDDLTQLNSDDED